MSRIKAVYVPVVPAKPDVMLTLPYETAAMLYELCGSIGGSSIVREHTDALYAALRPLNLDTKLDLDVKVEVL